MRDLGRHLGGNYLFELGEGDTPQLIRLISTVRPLIAPLIHLDALPVVARELVLWVAPCQLQRGHIRFSFIAFVNVVGYRPTLLAQAVGQLGSFGDSCHIGGSRCHHPTPTFVPELDPGGKDSQQ